MAMDITAALAAVKADIATLKSSPLSNVDKAIAQLEIDMAVLSDAIHALSGFSSGFS